MNYDNIKIATYHFLSDLKDNIINDINDLEIIYNLDENELLNHLNEEKYINIRKEDDSANLNDFYTLNQLKAILRRNNLKVSGNKGELLERISTQLPEELEKTYYITSKAEKFLKDNLQIRYYIKFFNKYPFDDFKAFYEDNIKNNANVISLKYVKKLIRDDVTDEKWENLPELYIIQSSIYEETNDYKKMLICYIKKFICDINPWKQADEHEIVYEAIDYDIQDKIQYYFEKTQLKNLKKVYKTACNQVGIPSFVIPVDVTYDYLERVLEGEDIDKLNQEIEKHLDIDLNNHQIYL